MYKIFLKLGTHLLPGRMSGNELELLGNAVPKGVVSNILFLAPLLKP